MHTLYVCCLIGGLAVTLIFALLGALDSGGGVEQGGDSLTGLPDGGLDLHVGSINDIIAAHGRAAGRWPVLMARLGSWLSPLPIAAGVLWYGGAGLAVEHVLRRAHHITAPRVALVAAVIGFVVTRSLVKLLIDSDTPALRESAAGAYGVVSAAVRVDAAGEVIYTLEGLRRSSAARSMDGMPLPRGTRVVIARRDRGIAWVVALDPLAFLDQDGAGPVAPGHGVTGPTRAPP